MVNSLDLVKEFQTAYEQKVNDYATIDDNKVNTLRVDLIQEELNELALALDTQDKVEVLDALTDLQYVLDGAFLSLGYWKYKDAALTEVHRSNMSKLGEDGKPLRREDGKILKGPRYSPPDLKSILKDDMKYDTID